ncbi:exodeoxyribonuclease V subunit beta [Alteromonas sp. D210916BOD_24]|uniref:exodeoxyribonuclease V subunit beta n=1 Tax=Alteromonas sp. D210916BOD_24 TaxID=3157618 RepID=UPI00399D2D65
MTVNTMASRDQNLHTPNLLDVANMPLVGRHLIEASAGTGKTFNITRLYLRLLLEKKLTVKDILVMTFTKAATEEIKGRIAKTLREALQLWQQAKDSGDGLPSDSDPVYRHLFLHTDLNESIALLQAAQLELDDASVFTIHGFCQHVIGQLAFNSGFAMSLNLSTDTSDLYLQAAEDFIRKVSQNEADFLLLAQSSWHVPERLLSEFYSTIRSPLAPILLDEAAIEAAFNQTLLNNPDTHISCFDTLLQNIEVNEGLLTEQLIKTPAHKKERPQELAALKAWLNECANTQRYQEAPSLALAFLDGRRYARNTAGVKEVLSPIKALSKAIDSAAIERDAAFAQIPVFTLINDAIHFIKDSVAKQKKQRGIIDFDDLICMLANEVVKPGNTLAHELRKKFPVALIDEFQDTDANQYAILDAVYPKASPSVALSEENNEVSTLSPSSNTALLMIGDPKQAIYRFRGGDIFTYLKAGRQADHRWVMNTNWRSVEGMVKAYNRLFYGAPVSSNTPTDVFGFNIHYFPVEFTAKAAAAKAPLIDSHSDRSAMNYVSLRLDEKQDATTMRRDMSQWIAQEIYRLLNEARFEGANQVTRGVRPQDIAILVKNRNEANIIKYVLKQQGLSCVYLSDRSNLFAAPEAQDVLRLLNGIWHANDNNKVASSLASPLWGYSAHDLVELLYHDNDSAWDNAYEKVLSLRDMWLQKGCMSVLLHLMQSSYQPSGNDVERALTNYQHLGEVLEKASITHQRPEQLLDWLSKQIHQPDSDEELTLRLESDSQLIRLITQHGSKGLEYPIVFIPFATSYKDAARNGKSLSHIFTYYDEAKHQLQLQLGQTQQAVSRVRDEAEAEDMRLMYVAVTRAAHRCYMGIMPLDGNEKSALARALGLNQQEQNDWQSILEQITGEEEAHSSHICADEYHQTYAGFQHEQHDGELFALQFTGTASEQWRLYSFSALSRLTAVAPDNTPNATRADIESVAVMQTIRDEEVYSENGNVEAATVLVSQPADSLPLESIDAPDASALRFGLAKGASAGNLLHDLLEHNDFCDPQWEDSGKELVARFGLEASSAPALYAWLDEVLQTSLYPTMTLSLNQVSEKHTLREAQFYFPMNDSQWEPLKDLLTAHRRRVAQGLNVQPIEVPHLMTPRLAGMMHGFIDLIFEHDGKYFVADYKSTWLGDALDVYLPAALMLNNQHHLYDLQYLIYSLALHRYLKNAIADYNCEEHFGGVYYLYLRGMHPQNRSGEGVFFTDITHQELSRLDHIFEHGTSEKKQSPQHVQQQFSFDDGQE